MPISCPYCSSSGPFKKEPFVSHSNTFGPSIDDLMLGLLGLFPLKLLENIGIVHTAGMKVVPDSEKKDDMNSWLSKEIKGLAVQLSLLGYDLAEPDMCHHPTTSMIQARKFVLNKLAEVMEKKDGDI